MSSPLDGLTAIITGDVEGFARHKVNDLITALGGKPVSSVSGKTGLVIIGEGAGVSKMHKTRTHGLTVIDADAFIELALNPDSWDGQPIGEPISAWDARNSDEPEPEPVIPFAERHLVGKATTYPTNALGKVVRQVRMWCSKCGHKWLGDGIHAEMVCPVATLGHPVVTEAPWQTHLEASVSEAQAVTLKPAKPQAATPAPVAPPRAPEFYEATVPVDEDPFDVWEASLAAVDPETVTRPTPAAPAGPLPTDW